MIYLNEIRENQFLKVKNSLLELEKGFIELKDREKKLKDRQKYSKPIIVSIDDMDRFQKKR